MVRTGRQKKRYKRRTNKRDGKRMLAVTLKKGRQFRNNVGNIQKT